MNTISGMSLGVAMLLGAVSAANAGSVTLDGSWQSGGYKAATVTNVAPGNPTFTPLNVAAGALKGSVQGFTGSQSFANNTNFFAYCVEFTEGFSSNPATNDYSLVNGASYAFGNVNAPPSNLADSFAISLRLGKLFSYLDTQAAVTTVAQTAAIQLAVWEIIYEKPTGVNLTLSNVANSNLYATSGDPTLIGDANNLLVASNNTLNTYGVYVLTRASNQDWLVLERNGGGPNSVPEPTSLALAFGALGFLGVVSRRRKSASA